jgi:hypothetical protein
MPDGPPEEERDKTELPTRARARSRRRAAGEPRGLTAFSPGELTPGRPPVAVPARRRPGPRRRLTRVRPHRQDRAIQLGGTCVSHETRVQRPLLHPTRGRFASWARLAPRSRGPCAPAPRPVRASLRSLAGGPRDGGGDRSIRSTLAANQARRGLDGIEEPEGCPTPAVRSSSAARPGRSAGRNCRMGRRCPLRDNGLREADSHIA